MLKEMAERTTVYIVTGKTDMRKGIDGLSSFVEGRLSHDVYDRSLFLFCGGSTRKIKGLIWDGDGFLLLSKRLENGRYRWPRSEQEAKLLSEQQLRWLFEGLEIEQKKVIKEGNKGVLY